MFNSFRFSTTFTFLVILHSKKIYLHHLPRKLKGLSLPLAKGVVVGSNPTRGRKQKSPGSPGLFLMPKLSIPLAKYANSIFDISSQPFIITNDYSPYIPNQCPNPGVSSHHDPHLRRDLLHRRIRP